MSCILDSGLSAPGPSIAASDGHAVTINRVVMLAIPKWLMRCSVHMYFDLRHGRVWVRKQYWVECIAGARTASVPNDGCEYRVLQ